ncbi:MAG: substrate-binding domain-containing protein, partial [Lentisphaeria bacterium]|nr:substrate-binding domain-containing protein [Lentisphaeria bacterium]
ARIQKATETGKADAVLHVCPSLDLRTLPPAQPSVLVAQDIEIVWPKACGYDLVTIDSRQSGAEAARYLKEIGCKRVARVGVRYEGRGVSPYCQQRLWGFEQEWGVPIPESMTFFCEHHTPGSGAAIAPRFLACDPLPDAVFATTDDLANGLCHALVAHGIQPGRDIKVIGCDGQPPLYPQDPILTTVAAPLEKMGKAAARMTLQRAKNPDDVANRVLLSCALRKGDTA